MPIISGLVDKNCPSFIHVGPSFFKVNDKSLFLLCFTNNIYLRNFRTKGILLWLFFGNRLSSAINALIAGMRFIILKNLTLNFSTFIYTNYIATKLSY